MSDKSKKYSYSDLSYTVKYSGRKTIGISIRPDSSVIVRVPYLTSDRTVVRIVSEKGEWIRKHLIRLEKNDKRIIKKSFVDGETQLYRGKRHLLKVNRSARRYIRFGDGIIETGLPDPCDEDGVRRLLYKGYREKAVVILPVMLSAILDKYSEQRFKPAGLVIRKMKRRWGSCSNKGVITLSTELVRLPDKYIEYIIVHELCHLRHHDHSKKYYKLLSSLIADWKGYRDELKSYIIQ